MKQLLTLILGAIILTLSCGRSSSEVIYKSQNPQTMSNPMDLDYRFAILKGNSRREAADPTMVLYKGTYYMFASKTGGYWYSDNLIDWKLVLTDQLPNEDYAPTVVEIRDTLFFMASHGKAVIYKSADPKSGNWSAASEPMEMSIWDPCLYLDDDGRLYVYSGCSPDKPIYGAELDPITFRFKTKPKALLDQHKEKYGWEVKGDYNTNYDVDTYIEGSWMNKHNGIYYLQYAAPGTEIKSYADGVYTSTSPLGDFKLAAHNPFAYKPEGFACGAGHGSTFQDKFGNYWHVGTVSISVKHIFERRLSLFPVFFDAKDNVYAYTRFGDYPIRIVQKKFTSPKDVESGWMLLSYDKTVEVSSAIDTCQGNRMVDEEIRTYWSAKTGGSNEWALVDLGKEYDVKAIQVNFGEERTTLFGRNDTICHRYTVEASKDKKKWEMIDDCSNSTVSNPHAYIEIGQPLMARYVRVKNLEVPDGLFAIRDLRIFGLGSGDKPKVVEGVKAARNEKDRRSVTLTWDKVDGVTGYNVCYGESSDMMYHNYTVYSNNFLTINSLSVDQQYLFKIQPFNENGITEEGTIVEIK